MLSYKNPFKPGAGIIPPEIGGKEKRIKKFVKILNDVQKNELAKNMILTGLRGTGKTVLMKEFEKICIENSAFPIYRDISHGNWDLEKFLVSLQNDLKKSVNSVSRKEKFKNLVKDTASHFESSEITFLENISVKLTKNDKSNIVYDEDLMYDFLSKAWKIFEKKFGGVIFLYDEFQHIQDGDSEEKMVLSEFLSTINKLQSEGYKYCFVLGGLPEIKNNIRKTRSNTERMFKILELENLNEKETFEAITEPLKKLLRDLKRI